MIVRLFFYFASSSPRLDGSSTLAGSSQQLLYSPKHRSGSPYGLRQIDLTPLRISSSNGLLPSPGPSQTGMEDSSLASHGSWGESAYHIHPRSGSGVSSISRGIAPLQAPDDLPSPVANSNAAHSKNCIVLSCACAPYRGQCC